MTVVTGANVRDTESFVEGTRESAEAGGVNRGRKIGKIMSAKEMMSYFQMNQGNVKIRKKSVSSKEKKTSSRAGAKFTVNQATRLKFQPCDLKCPTIQEKVEIILKFRKLITKVLNYRKMKGGQGGRRKVMREMWEVWSQW